ncbi:MAG: ATP-binding cassette domain-containing protein [Pirellulales bacterium]
MFHLDGVAKTYAGRPAVRPTSLRLAAGQATVLIGPSGCGKSTLLRLMIGLIEPDAGTVAFEGQQLTAANIRQLRRRMGYVLQDGGLFPHITARANITLLARHLGWDRQRIAKRVLELAGLTRFPADGLDRYPQQLSGGQLQRVGLMRALMLDPDALLLDEPLGSLDPLVRADLQQDLRDIFRSLGKTVVLVTHDLGEAAFFADRIVLLRDGAVVQDGTLAELWHRPVDPFVARFIQAQRGPQVPEMVA